MVPYSVKRISTAVLLSEVPQDDRFLRQRAFTMAFKVDGRVVETFVPLGVELVEADIEDQELWKLQLDYKIDLTGVRESIVGAGHLRLAL